jgi:type II secretory pathway pseudopilin PulG
MNCKRGLTIVDILIGISMFAVLTAIGTGIGRKAFTRSKLADERMQLQQIRVAMRNYFIDSAEYLAKPEYPVDTGPEDQAWSLLTTPVAYLNAIPRSNFYDEFSSQGDAFRFWYWGGGAETITGTEYRQKFYLVTSSGPDSIRSVGSTDLVEFDFFNVPHVKLREGPNFRNRLYDPTNGINSTGDLAATPEQLYN